MNVLILSCGTGEGHNSAAKAIEQSLKDKGIQSETVDVLTFKSKKASKKVAAIYFATIKRMPALFGLAYKLGAIYDNLHLPSPIYAMNARYAENMYSYIKKNGVTHVICTHLFAMEAMTAVRRKFGERIPCYGVMTDYTIHPFIKDTDLDGYFVPDTSIAKLFAEKGIPENKLHCTGIPIHPKFNQPLTKHEAREILNLPQDKKIVAIMTGGAGCGKVEKLCKALNRKVDNGHLLLAFTGRNEKLKAKLDKVFSDSDKVKTVAFTSDIHLYMKAADVVLSKSGGLSSTEIAATNVPIVHLKAIAGLETINAKYFSERGLSFRADTIRKAVKRTLDLLSDRERREKMLTMQRVYIKKSGTEEITKEITDDAKNGNALLDIIHNNRFSVGQYSVLQDYPEAATA